MTPQEPPATSCLSSLQHTPPIGPRTMALRRWQRAICTSIIHAVVREGTSCKMSIFSRIVSFLSLFKILLARFRPERFESLRSEIWQINEDEYKESFRAGSDLEPLNAVGDLGFSGSTFFKTPNSKFIIKSLPRRFEYSFFRDEMLDSYCRHVAANPASLLVRITDYLCATRYSLGGLLGFAPEYHIVMENILYGQRISERGGDEWECYDLKPINYFYPERDLLNGRLTSEATKSRLLDRFEDKLRITRPQFENLKQILERDVEFLQKSNVVDYSFFLVRYPARMDPPSLSAPSDEWRRGLQSTDGWKYRAVVLDFFWSKHKLQSQAMTGVVESYNAIAGHGPMSITTTPDDYQNRFLHMIDDMVEVVIDL